MADTYDRLTVGERLRLKRSILGLTQEEMSEKIGRAPKFYADIERGSCGMSVETLMSLSHTLNMSLDYIIYGKDTDTPQTHTDEVSAILTVLDDCPRTRRDYATRLLKLFIAACLD